MITNKDFDIFAREIATNGDPLLHSPAAMERFMKSMKGFYSNVPTPTGKYRSYNQCMLINFRNESEEAAYAKAWSDYLASCERAKKFPAGQSYAKLVADLMFTKRAEIIRAYTIAKLLHESVESGHAALACVRFKGTIVSVVRALVSTYGYSRDDISLIWGGMDSVSEDKRLSQQQIMGIITKLALNETVPKKTLKILEAQLAESDEDVALFEATKKLNLRLGSQTGNARQNEIDRFQSGKSKICLFTFSAGGVGLSLHHTDVDDFGNKVNNLPRECFLAPTYSAQDFVQGLGRAHRSIFSMSNTKQTILFYAGTIEEEVMLKVSIKLKCLTQVVQRKEDWHSCIWDGASAKSVEERKKIVLGDDINRTVEQGADDCDVSAYDEEDEDE